MIAEFYTKNFGFLYNSESTEQSLYQLRSQCLKSTKANTDLNDESYYQQLETLFAQYVFNQLDLSFDSTPTNTSQPIATHCSISEALSSPMSRTSTLHTLSFQLQQFLYASRLCSSNVEFSYTMGLTQDMKDSLVERVNLPPFSTNHRPITSFEEAQQFLTRNQFDSACCTCFIELSLLKGERSAFDQIILQEGINLAYISSLIAKDQNLDPLRLFLTAIMRSISLILVNQQLMLLEQLPTKKQLFSDIQTLLPKLDYWVAKDLGLPEDILHSLKSRFITTDTPPKTVNILHLAERCQLSLLLFKQALISNKEIQKILHTQGLSHLNLLHKLQLIRH